MIKAVFLDVDGVMTDGTKLYDSDHKCIGKKFCDRDFTAIHRMQKNGLYVSLISGDNWNIGMAIFRKIPIIITRDDKLERVKEFGYKPEEVVYVGDDIFDIPLLKWCGKPYCSYDAIWEVKEIAKSLSLGGHGVIADLYQELYG